MDNNIISVNHRNFTVVGLLGKGKGGYSYLASDGKNNFVVKQIHHEPCEYYSFGDKLQSELRDYERLKEIGIPMPELIDADRENERILKEYIPGETAAELIKKGKMRDCYIERVRDMCALLYPRNINIDYYPTNFVLRDEKLFYIDYECNDYSPEWDFEHWGIFYWNGEKSL